MYDCGFTRDDHWFRYRAAAIILEEDHVLFAGNDVDDYLYSVGGAVQIGETAEEAVVREVLEETGIRYEVDRLAFIHENFFEGDGTLGPLHCHEVAFYFLMKSRGTRQLDSHIRRRSGAYALGRAGGFGKGEGVSRLSAGDSGKSQPGNPAYRDPRITKRTALRSAFCYSSSSLGI